MFQNMTKREKTLAMIVGSTIPLVLIFFGWINFNSRYDAGKTKISTLERQIKEEQLKQLEGVQSRVRNKFYYLPSSFPSGGQQYVNRYQNWLLDLQRECAFKNPELSRPEADTLKFKSGDNRTKTSVVGKTYTFKFATVATLDRILEFCYKFESMDLLHKIKQLNLTPIRGPKGLTGDCKADFVVEVLALVDAAESADFAKRKKKLDLTIEDYEKVVVSRNIFGPANNAPKMRLSGTKRYYNDEEIKYTVSAQDIDKDDLEYEIVDAGGIEDATLVKDGSRAKFKCGKLENGEYKVKFRATDSGVPAKSVEAEWKFVVRSREPKVDRKPPVVKKVLHAEETKVTFIIARNGNYKATIKDYLTGEVFNLNMADDEKKEFQLDDKTWKVKDIRRRLVTLERDGKLLEYELGSVLSDPVRETDVAAVNDDAADSPEISDVSTSTGK